MFIARSQTRRDQGSRGSFVGSPRTMVQEALARSIRFVATARKPGTNRSVRKGTGLTIPEDWRESLLIHDGQEETTGAIIGEPLDSLEEVQRSLLSNREIMRSEMDRDVHYDWDEPCSSYPEEAIRCQHWNANWIPLGDWDSNCWGIDMDPGPTGVMGQIIDFGRDIEEKYVLAVSLAQFLEDLVDDRWRRETRRWFVTESTTSVSGSKTTIRAGIRCAILGLRTLTRIGRRASMANYHRQWSEAKLPESFKYAVAEEAVLPGTAASGPVTKQAQACVDEFIRAMHDFEMASLEVRLSTNWAISMSRKASRGSLAQLPVGR